MENKSKYPPPYNNPPGGYPTQYPPSYNNNQPGIYVHNPQGYQPGITPLPAPIPNEGWFQRNQRNKPASNSVGTAALIFISGGMSMAWSFGFRGNEIIASQHMLCCWFIGAIIGAFAGAIINNFLQKKIIMLFSSILVLIGGSLLIAYPTEYDAIIAARYLDGIGNGLTYVTAMIMIGEEVIKNIRGMIAATTDANSFTIGIYIQIIYAYTYGSSFTGDFYANQLQGILSVFFAAMAIIFGLLLIIESPVYFLVRGQEQNALESLRRLQRPHVLSTEKYQQLEILKSYVAMNKEMTSVESGVYGFPALIKLLTYRGMVTLSFSTYICVAFAISSAISTRGSPGWALIMFGIMRWVGCMVGCFSLDAAGRKRLFIVSSAVCAGMAIGVGAIFDELWNFINVSKMSSVMYMLFIFQFFSGLFYAPTSAYMTEAFPLAVKPFYIALSFIFESVLQIVLIVVFPTILNISSYFIAIGSLFIVFLIFGILVLPETAKISLQEAQIKFKKWLQ